MNTINAAGVVREAIVKGVYVKGVGMVGDPKRGILAQHSEEFPGVHQCVPGTFNVKLRNPPTYVPPCDAVWKYMARKRGEATRNFAGGEHLSPLANVCEINGLPLTAWIYRGGHGDGTLELIACEKIYERLNLCPGASVVLCIQEFAEPQPRMPGPPPCA